MSADRRPRAAARGVATSTWPTHRYIENESSRRTYRTTSPRRSSPSASPEGSPGRTRVTMPDESNDHSSVLIGPWTRTGTRQTRGGLCYARGTDNRLIQSFGRMECHHRGALGPLYRPTRSVGAIIFPTESGRISGNHRFRTGRYGDGKQRQVGTPNRFSVGEHVGRCRS